jgi:NSS family neurotransmitter:Na+ symporter
MEALNEGLGSGPIVGAIGVATLIAGLFVMAFGLQRGIVRSSKWCVPFFGVVVIYLIVNSFLLEGAPAKFAEFLRPDFAAMDMGNVFLALGQAFFSLSLGGTFFVIYGSYLKAEEDIPITAVWTSLGDAGAALLASLFIVPTILVFGLEMEKEGYMLTFNTLPRLFAQLPGGRLLGTFFLVAFALVAFLSNIAALQVFIGTVGERFDLRFRTLAPIVGAVEIALILFFAFNQNLIGAFDRALGSGMQCFGAAMALFALTWGLGRSTALRQIFRTTEGALPKLYFFWVKWVVPLGVLVALAGWILEEAKIFSAD